MKCRKIDLNYVNSVLLYHPDTGVFIWKRREAKMFSNPNYANPWNARFAGKDAGSIKSTGYVYIRLNNKLWLAHRLVWVIYNQIDIEDQLVIDHINHNPSDNRIINLRAVSQSENMKNMPLLAINKSGCHGVYYCKNKEKWAAQILIDGTNRHLGYFSDINEAIEKRKSTEIANGFHANHGKR